MNPMSGAALLTAHPCWGQVINGGEAFQMEKIHRVFIPDQKIGYVLYTGARQYLDRDTILHKNVIFKIMQWIL